MKRLLSWLIMTAFGLITLQCNSDSSSGSKANHPPNAPSSPIPASGAANVDITTSLEWTQGDPDVNDNLTFGVLVFLDPGLNTLWGGQTDLTDSYTSFSSNFSYSTTYYWFVYAEDGQDTTIGPVWSFTTKAPPTITLYSEDFEVHAVPGTYWDAGDLTSTSGLDYWGDQSSASGARVHSGTWSAYCADNSDVLGQFYDNYMDAYMQMKSPGVAISGYTNVNVSYWLYHDTEPTFDKVEMQYWNGSTWVTVTGSSKSGLQGWTQYTAGPFTGTTLYVAWFFHSDVNNVDEGVYVDDIVITGQPTSQAQLLEAGQPVHKIEDTGKLPDKNFARHVWENKTK